MCLWQLFHVERWVLECPEFRLAAFGVFTGCAVGTFYSHLFDQHPDFCFASLKGFTRCAFGNYSMLKGGF
jgi:hypothetical protein